MSASATRRTARRPCRSCAATRSSVWLGGGVVVRLLASHLTALAQAKRPGRAEGEGTDRCHAQAQAGGRRGRRQQQGRPLHPSNRLVVGWGVCLFLALLTITQPRNNRALQRTCSTRESRWRSSLLTGFDADGGWWKRECWSVSFSPSCKNAFILFRLRLSGASHTRRSLRSSTTKWLAHHSRILFCSFVHKSYAGSPDGHSATLCESLASGLLVRRQAPSGRRRTVKPMTVGVGSFIL